MIYLLKLQPVKKCINKLSLLYALVFFSYQVSAQFALTSDNIATPWEDYKAVLLTDTIDIQSGDTGTNVIWDFGNLVVSTDSLDIKFLTPSGTNYNSQFNNSDQVKKTGENSYRFYSLSISDYVMDGLVNDSNIVVPYSDPEIIYQFPMNFGSEFTDDFKANFIIQSINTYRSGSTTVKSDAYGTLYLPTDTLINVIRIKTHQIFKDSSYVFATPYEIKYDFTTYVWYSENYNYPVLRMTNFITAADLVAKDTAKAVYQLVFTEISTGIEQSKEEVDFSCYVKDKNIHFSYNCIPQANLNIQIINMLGQVVYKAIMGTENSQVINIDKSGIYFVNIHGSGIVKTVKVFIN